MDVQEELVQEWKGQTLWHYKIKKIMPPPWLAHREIERYSIGWRMGYGEDYIDRFGDWLDTLSRRSGRNTTLFPEPVTWKGWWDDEDSSSTGYMVTSWWMRGSRKASQSTPASGSSRSLPGGSGAVPVLGPSACRGRPADKKLPQPVVDGGLLYDG